MPASSKRAKRVEKRNQYRKQTGQIKKAHKGAKRQAKFDTKNEPDNVVRDLGNRKKLHTNDLCSLQPKTLNQERFLTHYYDGIPIIQALGKPGVGKSMLSLYCAFSQVLDPATPFQRVIVIRSAVQSREQGHLPGDLESKSQPYEAAYQGLAKEIFPKFNDPYLHLKTLGYLEFHSTSFLRSVTFDDSVIICSEAQNFDFEELYTCISRAGSNSRIIIEGDTGQADLQRKREKSGLPDLERVLAKMPASMSAKIEYTSDDIVRSDLVKQFIIACHGED